MSEPASESMSQPPARSAGRATSTRLPSVLWLTCVWVLLWGTFTPASIVGGVLVAALVTALFRLPAATDRLPVRPLRLLWLLLFLLWDLVVSGAEVSWQVLRHGPRARGAIMAVPLISSSDRVVTVMANALSLSPGTMALQIDHDHDVWYVYALGPRDGAGVERARRRVLDMQRRVLAALGTPEELSEAERLVEAIAR
jgi:multicomponent Na+:H+ antiporter subunit E